MSHSSAIPWPAPTDPWLYIYDWETLIDVVAIPIMVTFSSLTTKDQDTTTTTTIGFFSRDPIGFEGSPYNLFEYVEGNPLRFTDPYGLVGMVEPRPRTDPFNPFPKPKVPGLNLPPIRHGFMVCFREPGCVIGMHWCIPFNCDVPGGV